MRASGAERTEPVHATYRFLVSFCVNGVWLAKLELGYVKRTLMAVWLYAIGIALNTRGSNDLRRLMGPSDRGAPALGALALLGGLGGIALFILGMVAFQWWLPIVAVLLGIFVLKLVFAPSGISPQLFVLFGVLLAATGLALHFITQ
jgi:hypothetical protein